MRKELAARLSADLLECSGKLDRSVAVLGGLGDGDLYQAYRKLVGQVMGTFYVEILRDIFEQYPDLEPESLK